MKDQQDPNQCKFPLIASLRAPQGATSQNSFLHDALRDPNHFEIHQSPASGLTLLYRATDNTLYATDQGTSFAPPVR